jgi:hypothetical protein
MRRVGLGRYPDVLPGKGAEDRFGSSGWIWKGWSPPGVTKGAVPGLEFLTKLPPEEKTALIAYLRTL